MDAAKWEGSTNPIPASARQEGPLWPYKRYSSRQHHAPTEDSEVTTYITGSVEIKLPQCPDRDEMNAGTDDGAETTCLCHVNRKMFPLNLDARNSKVIMPPIMFEAHNHRAFQCSFITFDVAGSDGSLKPITFYISALSADVFTGSPSASHLGIYEHQRLLPLTAQYIN